jgi:hypothetical protein
MEKKKKTKKASDEGGGKEHKKPWQETYATPEEIDMNRRLLASDARPEGEDDGDEGVRGDT